MEDINLLRDDENSIYQKILFERPISRLQARRIGLLAGRHAQLKKINDIHQIILTMNHDVAIVAELDLKKIGVPAEIYLQPSKKITEPFSNSDEAIQLLLDCSYIVVGMDIEISSRLQIFLEKCINTRNSPIVFTSESIGLFKTSPNLTQNRKGDLYICSTKYLIELANYLDLTINFQPNAGIYNKIGLLKMLAEHLQAHIICVENYQVLSCSYTDTTKATVTNTKNSSDIPIDYYFTAILLSLLCDVPNPESDIIQRILTAGYLLRNSLLTQKEFLKNLRQNIQQ